MLTASSYKPTISIDEAQLSEIKDWKVDGEHKVEMVLKQVSSGRDQYNNKKLTARFEIVSVRAIHDKNEDLNSLNNNQFKQALAREKRKSYGK